MSFKPHSWYPPPDSNGDNVVMQAPPIARVIVDKSDSTATDASADYIIDSYAASISHFVDACRRNYSQGTPSYWRGQDTLPGLKIDVEINNHREIITFTVKPSEFRQSQENNLDGYIAWVRPPPVAVSEDSPVLSDAILYINGYAVIDTKKFGKPVLDTGGVYLVLFGPTALRCHSLADNENPFKAGVTEPDHKTPVKLVSAIVPGRAKVDNHDDLPAYFALQWSQPFNVYASELTAALPIAGYLQFEKEDVAGKLSPLLAAGANSVVVWPQGLGEGTLASLGDDTYGDTPETLPMPNPGDNNGEIVFAEFYDRKNHRIVQQSWTTTPGPGGHVTVNDKPLWWFAGGALTNDTQFDLTPFSITLKPPIVDLTSAQTTGVTPGRASTPALGDAQYSEINPVAFWRNLSSYFATRIALGNIVLTDSGIYMGHYTADLYDDCQLALTFPDYFAAATACKAAESAFESALSTLLTTAIDPGTLASTTAVATAAQTTFNAAADALNAAITADIGPDWESSLVWGQGSGRQANFYSYRTPASNWLAAVLAYGNYRVTGAPIWKNYKGTPIAGMNHRTFTVADSGAVSVGNWTTAADTA